MQKVLAGTLLALAALLPGCSSSCSDSYGEARKTYIQAANREIDLELNEALATGDLERARGLIADGADVNASFKGEGGMTNLMMAASAGTDDIVSFLLNAGAEPDQQRDDGGTALLVAASRGHLESVVALLEFGADPTLADNAGRTPISVAQERGHTSVVEVLREDRSEG